MDLTDRQLDDAFACFRGAFPSTTCDEAAENVLRGWLRAMVQWNKKLDLTAARSATELFDLMLADAFAIAPRLPAGATVVDVGTGAGAPGVALAALRPDLRVTLVEPLAKRTSFLRTALASVGRTDIVILRGKGEELPAFKGDLSASFDVAISRATLAPADWLNLGDRLAGATGSVWVLTAREEPPSGRPALTVEETLAYRWPGSQVERTATRYEKRGI